jgi:hypothetical protein
VTFPSSTPFTALAYVVRVQLKTPVAVERLDPARGASVRFSQGILTLSDRREGRIRIIDARGHATTHSVVAGRVELGDLPAGSYKFLLTDRNSEASVGVFAVVH